MAAAETFVFNIAQKVLEKLGSLAFQEARLIWVAESDLGRLEKTLSTVKAVLLDAEEQQATDLFGDLACLTSFSSAAMAIDGS
nr:hypothetical protein CFP56_48577 [Quercus suber]